MALEISIRSNDHPTSAQVCDERNVYSFTITEEESMRAEFLETHMHSIFSKLLEQFTADQSIIKWEKPNGA